MIPTKNAPVLIHNLHHSVHEAFAKAQEYSEQIKAQLSLTDNIRSFIHQGSSSITLSFLESIPLLNKRTSGCWSWFTSPPELSTDPLFSFSPAYFSLMKQAKTKLEALFAQDSSLLTNDAKRILALFTELELLETMCTLIASRMQGIQKS